MKFYSMRKFWHEKVLKYYYAILSLCLGDFDSFHGICFYWMSYEEYLLKDKPIDPDGAAKRIQQIKETYKIK